MHNIPIYLYIFIFFLLPFVVMQMNDLLPQLLFTIRHRGDLSPKLACLLEWPTSKCTRCVYRLFGILYSSAWLRRSRRRTLTLDESYLFPVTVNYFSLPLSLKQTLEFFFLFSALEVVSRGGRRGQIQTKLVSCNLLPRNVLFLSRMKVFDFHAMYWINKYLFLNI